MSILLLYRFCCCLSFHAVDVILIHCFVQYMKLNGVKKNEKLKLVHLVVCQRLHNFFFWHTKNKNTEHGNNHLVIWVVVDVFRLLTKKNTECFFSQCVMCFSSHSFTWELVLCDFNFIFFWFWLKSKFYLISQIHQKYEWMNECTNEIICFALHFQSNMDSNLICNRILSLCLSVYILCNFVIRYVVCFKQKKITESIWHTHTHNMTPFINVQLYRN